MLYQLGESRTYAPFCVIGEVSDGLLGRSPFTKEIEDFASNGSTGNRQSPGEIMKKQLTVLPVGEQAPSPAQLDRPLPHGVIVNAVRLQEHQTRFRTIA